MVAKELKQANRRLLGRLTLAAMAMFGFGFALVPLYDAMCDVLGFNGRFVAIQDGTYQPEKVSLSGMGVDKSRTVTVEFLASVQANTPWEFRPLVNKLELHPGEMHEVEFYAKNLTDRVIEAQAIPSLVPGKAVKYFTKIECFCFNKQTFQAGEEKRMPLRFFVAADLPKDVHTISLAYTFFDLGQNQNKRDELASAQSVVTKTSTR